MCLIVSDSKIYKAENDIKCYKVLKKDENKNLCSIYYSFKWKLDFIYYSILGDLKKVGTSYNLCEGFHTFVSFNTHVFNYYKRIFGEKLVIAECIIPKSSKFYYGKFGGCSSYVSDRLIVDKIIYESF